MDSAAQTALEQNTNEQKLVEEFGSSLLGADGKVRTDLAWIQDNPILPWGNDAIKKEIENLNEFRRTGKKPKKFSAQLSII